MNERIRQLAEQAEWSVRWGNPNNYEEYNRALDEWQEKFAELIVKECVRYFNEDYERNFETLWREDLSKGMKEHFGVEE